MAAPTTRNLAILLTDIKGFTDKTSHRSRADIQRLLDDHRDVVLPVLQERGGRLIKTIGDAFLMVFDSPTDAVLAGVSAQEALAKRNAPLPEDECASRRPPLAPDDPGDDTSVAAAATAAKPCCAPGAEGEASPPSAAPPRTGLPGRGKAGGASCE